MNATARRGRNLKMAAFEADDMTAAVRILWRSFDGIKRAAPDAKGKKLAAKAEAAIGELIDDLSKVAEHYSNGIESAK